MSLRPLPYHEVKRKREAAGFAESGQKGSHVKCVRQTAAGTYTAIVPHHRDVSVGVLRSVCRQAGLTPEAFEAL